jgi:hypothetical protein
MHDFTKFSYRRSRPDQFGMSHRTKHINQTQVL